MGIIFTNARVIDGLGEVRENAHVLVEDAHIASIGDSAEAPIVPAFNRIDLNGRTLMPGVIDCHVHLSIDGAPDAMGEAVTDTDAIAALRVAHNAERTLAAGITTVRDMGAKDGVDLAFKQALREGLFRHSPHLFVSGRPITMTGGHCWQIGRQTDGIDNARTAAREQIKAGVDWIKLMATGGILTQGTELGAPQLGQDEMLVVVDEARKAGRKTAVHAHGATGIKNAIRAGVISIEHGYFLDDEAIALMLERNCTLVPTAAAVKLVVEHGVDAGIPCAVVRKAASAIDSQIETCRKAWKSGVRFAMGTDAGTPYNRHGDNMQELEAMVAVGLSPMEAIVMATRDSAKLLEIEDRVGTIEEGKLADLIVIDGDPLSNIAQLKDKRRIDYVVQSGNLVARQGVLVEP